MELEENMRRMNADLGREINGRETAENNLSAAITALQESEKIDRLKLQTIKTLEDAIACRDDSINDMETNLVINEEEYKAKKAEHESELLAVRMELEEMKDRLKEREEQYESKIEETLASREEVINSLSSHESELLAARVKLEEAKTRFNEREEQYEIRMEETLAGREEVISSLSSDKSTLENKITRLNAQLAEGVKTSEDQAHKVKELQATIACHVETLKKITSIAADVPHLEKEASLTEQSFKYQPEYQQPTHYFPWTHHCGNYQFENSNPQNCPYFSAPPFPYVPIQQPYP